MWNKRCLLAETEFRVILRKLYQEQCRQGWRQHFILNLCYVAVYIFLAKSSLRLESGKNFGYQKKVIGILGWHLKLVTVIYPFFILSDDTGE